MKNNNKGFSLVELIVVIAIMAILAAIAIPTFAHFITKAHEASDAELLHNINYIFNTACIENGVDVKDVTAATWDKTNKCVTGIKVNGVANTDIENSFKTHFDLTEEEFKLIENIYFNPSLHEFVEGTSVYAGLVFDPEQIDAINNSNFKVLGTEALLDRIGLATDILYGLAENGNELVGGMLTNTANMTALATYLGYTLPDEEAEFLAKYNSLVDIKAAELKQQYKDSKTDEEIKSLAAMEILSNNAVLVAATNSGFDKDSFILEMSSGDAKDTIQSNLTSGTDEGVSTALSQAAFVYGMYTAYAAKNEITVDDNFSMEVVLDAMDDPLFQQYMATESSADVKAYYAAMGMINTSSQNKDAVEDVLLNGFDNENLNSTMKDALN